MFGKGEATILLILGQVVRGEESHQEAFPLSRMVSVDFIEKGQFQQRPKRSEVFIKGDL
jgi:hypothetical protein